MNQTKIKFDEVHKIDTFYLMCIETNGDRMNIYLSQDELEELGREINTIIGSSWDSIPHSMEESWEGSW